MQHRTYVHQPAVDRPSKVVTALPLIHLLTLVKKGRANELYARNGNGAAKVGFLGGQHEDISARRSARCEKVEKSQNLERLDCDTDWRAFWDDGYRFRK